MKRRKMKSKINGPKTFTCSRCEEEHPIDFMYEDGFAYVEDEDGLDSDEMTYYEICGNCHHSAFVGMATVQTADIDEDDLPF